MIDKNKITKAEIIEELHSYGEMWANDSYSKEYLEKYLKEYKKATEMTDEELYATIRQRNKKDN